MAASLNSMSNFILRSVTRCRLVQKVMVTSERNISKKNSDDFFGIAEDSNQPVDDASKDQVSEVKMRRVMRPFRKPCSRSEEIVAQMSFGQVRLDNRSKSRSVDEVDPNVFIQTILKANTLTVGPQMSAGRASKSSGKNKGEQEQGKKKVSDSKDREGFPEVYQNPTDSYIEDQYFPAAIPEVNMKNWSHSQSQPFHQSSDPVQEGHSTHSEETCLASVVSEDLNFFDEQYIGTGAYFDRREFPDTHSNKTHKATSVSRTRSRTETRNHDNDEKQTFVTSAKSDVSFFDQEYFEGCLAQNQQSCPPVDISNQKAENNFDDDAKPWTNGNGGGMNGYSDIDDKFESKFEQRSADFSFIDEQYFDGSSSQSTGSLSFGDMVHQYDVRGDNTSLALNKENVKPSSHPLNQYRKIYSDSDA